MHDATPGTSTAHSPYPCSSNRSSNDAISASDSRRVSVLGEVLAHRRVGVERGVRLEIVGAPTTQEQALGSDLRGASHENER